MTVDRRATAAGLRAMVKDVFAWRHRVSARRAWSYDPDEYGRHQAAALRRLYAFAIRRVPYYRQRSGIYPAAPARLDQVSDLLFRLPILTKEEVRGHNEELWPRPPLPLTTYHATSGTSGTPLRLAATLDERGATQAILQEWYRRICGRRRPRTLALSGFLTPAPGAADIHWRDVLTGDVYLSIYSLEPANRQRISNLLRSMRPRLIYGYASAVRELALLLGERPLAERGERIAVVTSEVMQPGWRGEIESRLCHRVFDLYGSQEGSHMAIECPLGSLHVNPQVGILELLDEEGREVSPGMAGRVVVTGLLHRAMPLLRYDLGDTAISTGFRSDCGCGCRWQTLGPIQGRSEDLVRTPDGRRIGYLCFHATKALAGLRESQLVQRDWTRFQFNLVPADPGSFDRAGAERHIRGELESRLGYPVAVEFHYLESVTRGSRGKFKAVVVDFDAAASGPETREAP